jgi:hypothetical protein
METATWVIAAASVVNLVVLGVYAWFTHGIWRETQQTALRTEDLARRSADAFRLQFLATYLQEIRAVSLAFDASPDAVQYAELGAEVAARLLRDAFPDLWRTIPPDLHELADTVRGANTLRKQSP